MSEQEKNFSKQEQIKGLIEQLDSYINHYHGGSVEFISLEGNNVRVRLGGSCTDCPLKANTLHGWVEGTLRQFFPELNAIEAVEN